MFVVNEIVSTCLTTGIVKHLLQFGLLIRGCVKTIKNILANITREENRLLLNDRNLLMVPLGVKSANVTAVEKYLSAGR